MSTTSVNTNRSFCFRITHRDNLANIIQNGILNKNHLKADPDFIKIGNPEIIDVRSTTLVKLEGYGFIGDYVPFYFAPRSIMLYNIVTGHWDGKVKRHNKDEIIIIRCLIDSLSRQPKWFFTDGQANDQETTHYNNIEDLNLLDWENIQKSVFHKSDGDVDRPRRYQAEFLVLNEVPVNCIEAICVYTDEMRTWTQDQLTNAGVIIPVYIHKPYFFD